jgi:hypothetical protein
VKGQGKYRVHEAPGTWQGSNEKVSKDREPTEARVSPCVDREVQKLWTGNVQIVERFVLFAPRLVPTRSVGTCSNFDIRVSHTQNP